MSNFPKDYAENKFSNYYDFERLKNLPKSENIIILDLETMTVKEIGEAYKKLDEALRKLSGS
jgi:hypothetical protein